MCKQLKNKASKQIGRSEMKEHMEKKGGDWNPTEISK
jgi:hypothetical protein